jgi:hypothetical protein
LNTAKSGRGRLPAQQCQHLPAAESAFSYIAGYQQITAALRFNRATRLFGIALRFWRIDNGNISAFPRAENRNHAANPRISAGDQCDFVFQLF